MQAKHTPLKMPRAGTACHAVMGSLEVLLLGLTWQWTKKDEAAAAGCRSRQTTKEILTLISAKDPPQAAAKKYDRSPCASRAPDADTFK